MSHRYTTILVFCLSCLLLFGFVPASQADDYTGRWIGGTDVLITAVPEPATLVLIGIAAIALSARALRRRKPAAPSRR